MTYSNRPYASPYQHGSEFGKSNDSVVINKVNTFVMNDTGEMSLPGTWSDPYPFSAKSIQQHKEKIPEFETEYISPICEAHLTAGHKTIDMCKPSPPNCPMSRPLEPQRDINPGMWTYYKKAISTIDRRDSNKMKILIVLALVVVFILFVNA